jgi:pseudo-rSAM protein
LDDTVYQLDVIHSFLNEIREKYMGDIIDASLSLDKPVIFSQNLNLLRDIKKEVGKIEKTDLLVYLNEIRINADNANSSDIDKIVAFINGISSNFNIILSGIAHKHIDCIKLFNCNKSNITVELYHHQLNEDSYNYCFALNCNMAVIVDFSMNTELSNDAFRLLMRGEVSYKVFFCVMNIDNYQQAKKIITKLDITDYIISPVYNGHNISFFEKYVYMTKEDILSEKVLMREVFAHQTLNT